MKFIDWFLRTDIEYDSSDITIGSPMFWRAMQVIAIILLVMAAVTAFAGVSQDGASDWRISTYPVEEGEKQHLVFGLVFTPYKGIVYERIYGSVDAQCSGDVMALKLAKAKAKARAYQTVVRALELLDYTDYTISMTVSICNTEWYVVYLTRTDNSNASKEVYDEVMEALQ